MTSIITCPVHRPYAKGSPSVTTIINACINKGGPLAFAAAKETWQHLRANPDRLDDPAARVYFRGLWDRSMFIGTIVHGVNRVWALGEGEANLEAIATEALTNKDGTLRKGWTPDMAHQLALDANPYVDALEAWTNDWQPEWTAVEYVVRHPKPNDYAGQADGVAVMRDGRTWMIDFKTTRSDKDDTYPAEWRLQFAGYTFADEIVLYDENGKETGTIPNDLGIERHAIVQLRNDGTYRFYPLAVGPEQHARFLQMRNVYEWLNKEADNPKVVHIDRPDSLVEPLAASLQEGAA